MNFWEIIKYFLLGAIQGLTEPLPISSSAHMGILAYVFGLKDNSLTFEILINFASFLAITIILFKQLKTDLFILGKVNFSFIFKLITASIPLVIVGFLLHDVLEKSVNNMTTIAISLIFTSLILFVSYLLIDKANSTNITYKHSFIMGIFQSFAVLPGITRSGTVMLGGLVSKLNLKETLKFSFYMYMIASLGSMVLKTPELIASINKNTIPIPYYLIAFVSAFFFTTISFKWFMKIISKTSLLIFLVYTAILGFSLIVYNFIY